MYKLLICLCILMSSCGPTQKVTILPETPRTTSTTEPTESKITPNKPNISSSLFITTKGVDFYLNNQIYYFSGTNQYYLFYKSQKMVDEVIEAAANMNLNSIRTWGFCDGVSKDGYSFQPSPRVYDEATFKKMDYIIYKASKHNIKLVIPFVNNWDDMGGMLQYAKWAGTSNHDDFYVHPWIRQVYKDYIQYFLNRTNSITGIVYKNDPTILMWELANEPRRQSNNGVDFQLWVEEMSQFVKSIDSNHLLSIGDEGFFGDVPNGDWMHNGSQGTDFIKNNQTKTIDVATFHIYPDPWGLNEQQAKKWIEDHIVIAKKVLGKPVYMGEFGIQNKGTRDRIYSEWYDLSISRGMSGIMFWLLSGHQDDGSLYPDFDGFTVYPDSSTSSIIRNKSEIFLNRFLD